MNLDSAGRIVFNKPNFHFLSIIRVRITKHRVQLQWKFAIWIQPTLPLQLPFSFIYINIFLII